MKQKQRFENLREIECKITAVCAVSTELDMRSETAKLQYLSGAKWEAANQPMRLASARKQLFY